MAEPINEQTEAPEQGRDDYSAFRDLLPGSDGQASLHFTLHTRPDPVQHIEIDSMRGLVVLSKGSGASPEAVARICRLLEARNIDVIVLPEEIRLQVISAR